MDQYSGSELFHVPKYPPNESHDSYKDLTGVHTSASALHHEIYNQALVDRRNFEIINANLLK